MTAFEIFDFTSKPPWGGTNSWIEDANTCAIYATYLNGVQSLGPAGEIKAKADTKMQLLLLTLAPLGLG